MKLSDKRRVFSDNALAKLEVPARGHTHYYDTQCPSLAVRVTAAGTKSYKAFNRAGTPQFLPIGEVGEVSLDFARLQAQAMLRTMRETGLTPKAQQEVAEQERQKEKRLDVPLGTALDLYLAARLKPSRKRTIKQATADNMRREVSKYLSSLLDKPLRSLSYSILNEQHELIIDRGAPSVADRVMRNVGTLIRFIEEREEVHLFGRNLRYGLRGNPVMGRKIVLSGESRVCDQNGLPLIHHDFRRTFCSVAAGEAGVDVFAAMRLTLHKFGGGASQTHSDYVQLEHLRPCLDRIAAAILKLGERPERHDGLRPNNVLAFVPRRSASPTQPHQIKAPPLIVA